MIQLDNRSLWSAGLYPGWGLNRKRQQTLVIKAGYRFDSKGQLTPLPQPPIEEADRYRGAPESSSLEVASDIAPFKQGGELLLSGSAHPPQAGAATMAVEVSLRQGDNNYWSKEVRVFGPRRWQRKLLTPLPSPPAPLTEPVPLTYENAFGGTDPAHPDQACLVNPAGVGFSLRGLGTKGLALPQIEDGAALISSPASRPRPAGFSPLAPHWEPRCHTASDIDLEALAYGGCPWAKEPSFALYNVAPADQRFDKPFSSELTLHLKGLCADAPQGVLLNLPPLRPRVLLVTGGTAVDQTACCDTLLIDTDRMELCLLLRCALPWDAKTDTPGTVILQDLAAEEEAVAEPLEGRA